jgi:ribosomal protein L13E
MSEKAAKKKKAPAKKAASKRAAKPKKEESSKREEQPEIVVEKAELKPTPQPWVLARHARSMRHRTAKGYSLGELGSAEIGFDVAKSLGVPIDIRRRSVLDENTDKLKGWYKPGPKPVHEAKPKADKPVKVKAKAKKKTKKASK